MTRLFFVFVLIVNITLFASKPYVELGDIILTKHNEITHIQSHSEKTHLVWKTFDVLENQRIYFKQPSACSATINQVLDEPSKIFGKMESNGHLFLLNPNGIIIGKDAKIQAASFIASTLNTLSFDNYFNSQEMEFFGGDGTIVNLGHIEALSGDVYLISKTVDNQGEVIASQGSVNLCGTDQVIIYPGTQKKMAIQSDASEVGMVINFGHISGGAVNIQAKNSPFALAIKHSGSIESTPTTSISDHGIFICASGSEVHVEEKGSLVCSPELDNASTHILGHKVYLKDQTVVKSELQSGGGELFIGGSFRGGDSSMPHSAYTYVGKDVVLSASAYQEGTGGQVVVWSDGNTEFYGKASACGGILRGDGGIIEISGKTHLIFDGVVDASAIKGQLGTCLFDPSNILIGSLDLGGSFNGGSPTNTYVPTDVQSFIDTKTIFSALKLANVVIDTTSGKSAAGDIEITSPFSYNATEETNGNLTLSASGNVWFNALFCFVGHPGSSDILTINAQNKICSRAPLCLDNLAIDFTANTIEILSSVIGTNLNTTTLTAQSDILFCDQTSYDLSFSSNSTCTFDAGNTLTIHGVWNFSNDTLFTLKAGNQLIVDNMDAKGRPTITFAQ